MKHNNKIFILFLASTLCACAASNNNHYVYNELTIKNNSGAILNDVKLKSKLSGKIFSCGFIPIGGFCSNEIKNTQYRRSTITVFWKSNKSRAYKDEIIFDLPPTADISIPLKGMINMLPEEKIHHYLYQKK